MSNDPIFYFGGMSNMNDFFNLNNNAHGVGCSQDFNCFNQNDGHSLLMDKVSPIDPNFNMNLSNS